MAERNELLQIVVGALHRHAAHGDILAQMFAALRQHDSKRARGNLGVFEKQLVKIAHAIKQQAIRIGRLDLDILRNHRRRPGGSLRVSLARINVCNLGHGRQASKLSPRAPRNAPRDTQLLTAR